ncbi:MAG: hypothetical protein HYZ28_21650 [Myxococcales bacterium]|nr:hypothetical protein [Myxococcales bacterium]
MSSSHSTPLRIRRDESEEGLTVQLSGEITEDARLDQVGPLEGRRILFDLSGVSRVNSCGVREWINFVKRIPAGADVRFTRLSPVMVGYLNLVANFLQGRKPLSFLAPYYCELCDRHVELLFEVGKEVSAASRKLPERRCPTCHGKLVLEEIETDFLAFLAD